MEQTTTICIHCRTLVKEWVTTKVGRWDLNLCKKCNRLKASKESLQLMADILDSAASRPWGTEEPTTKKGKKKNGTKD